MKIGFIGLGKMGSQMVRRITESGHEVIAYDLNEQALAAAGQMAGVTAADDRSDMVQRLGARVIIWLMIPSQFVDAELDTLLDLVPAGSTIIDGGNSDYRLTVERSKKCAARDVQMIDVGTSGGILGYEHGFSMMVGGDKLSVDELQPVLVSLAQDQGWHYFGESGTGHYVKMVHNGIEYGMMQSYAEGYRMLHDGPFAGLDLAAAGRVWARGSIIHSTLNDIAVSALEEDKDLSAVDGVVAESGEARWTIETAENLGIQLPAIQAALQVRIDSQNGDKSFATKLLAAMRNKFGGHNIDGSK